MKELDKKIEQSVKLLQCTCKGKTVELCYSGGKDSDVILELAKMAGIAYVPIYRNTTIDPPGTIKHCLSKGVKIARPRKSFYEVVAQKGMPTRRARFCCQVMKEYKIMDTAIQGIRRAESTKRAKLYKEPVLCRLYDNSKKNKCDVILPILEWSNKDVLEFVKLRHIRLHPFYYEFNGLINIEKRLGCMGCPLKADKGLAEFKQYPKIVKAWLRAANIWWNEHPNTKSHDLFADVYEIFIGNVFFDSYEDMRVALHCSAFGDLSAKALLENYFHINL